MRLNALPHAGGYTASVERADFAAVLPPHELDETYASCLILTHSLHSVKHDVIQKTGIT